MQYIDVDTRSGWTQIINLCQILRGMNGDQKTIEGVKAAFVQVFGTPDREVFRPSDDNCTAGAFFVKDRRGLLLCHGTDEPGQSVGEALQYLPTPSALAGFNQSEIDQPTDTFNRSAGAYMKAMIDTLGELNIGELTCVGHSFGHSISCNAFLQKFCPAGARPPRTQIVSFGGNGWANSGQKELIETNAEIIRIQNEDDPVALAPWIFADAAQTILGIRGNLIRRIGNFYHVGRAYNFSPQGELSHDNFVALADRAGVVRWASIGEWFYSFVGDTVTPHQTSVYISRMRKYRDTLSDRAPIVYPDQTPRVRPEWFPPPGQENEFIAQTAQTIASAVAALPTRSQTITEPTQGNIDPTRNVGSFFPSDAFLVRRQVGGLYGVVQQGVVCSIHQSKRSAKREAKQRNKSRSRIPPT